MERLPARLDWLFRTIRAPDDREYSYREVAEGIQRVVGWTTSASYLQELRTGSRNNPSIKHLIALAAFFGVPVLYFFDEEREAQVVAQLEVASALRDPLVRQLAQSAAGVSPEALAGVTAILEHIRRLEARRASDS
jgi:transcriptional regulator with XRE-family HTH domain